MNSFHDSSSRRDGVGGGGRTHVVVATSLCRRMFSLSFKKGPPTLLVSLYYVFQSFSVQLVILLQNRTKVSLDY